MNNIEILEELIENYKSAYPEEESWCAIYPLQMKAIENLIQENKYIHKELNLMQKGLNDYSKVIESKDKEIENLIKENKDLKEEKVLNEKILYFANNTICNYKEGYKEGYKAGLHKEITAIEIVAEERERFIIGQEIKRLKDTIHELHNQLDVGNKRVKEDYIQKSKVKEKIEEIKRNDYSSYDTCLCLQELLEEGE